MDPEPTSRVHHRLAPYLLHLTGWWIRSCFACYGSVVSVTPSLDWSVGRPRYWRQEARRGLRDCARLLAGPTDHPEPTNWNEASGA